MEQYLRTLAELIGRVPNSDFGRGPFDLLMSPPGRRTELLRLLDGRPSYASVKSLYKAGWFGALVDSGVLADGMIRMGRGMKCLAMDGDLCLSLAEKTIDDLLFLNGIPHGKELPYTEGLKRADFLINGAFVEYFGLMNDPAYAAKVLIKRDICERHGITLIEIHPRDLADLAALLARIARDADVTPNLNALHAS